MKNTILILIITLFTGIAIAADPPTYGHDLLLKLESEMSVNFDGIASSEKTTIEVYEDRIVVKYLNQIITECTKLSDYDCMVDGLWTDYSFNEYSFTLSNQSDKRTYYITVP